MSTIVRRSYTVTSPNGLHMRPLQAFVDAASKYQANVQVGKKDTGEMVNGKSMIHLLTLAAVQGTEIVVEVDGADADAAIEALWEVLQRVYDD